MRDLAELAESIGLLDEPAQQATRALQDRLTKPRGALGRLEELSVWLAGVQGICPPAVPRRPRVVVFAGDHGIARTAGVSAYPPEVTAQMVVNVVAGGAGVNVLAAQVGAGVRVLDLGVDVEPDALRDLAAVHGVDLPDDVTRYKVCRGSGSLDREDALTREQTEQALEAGMAVADEEIDAGADLLVVGDLGIGDTTPAAVITGVFAGLDAASVIGRGTGIDDATWMRKCAAIRDGMRRARPLRADPVAMLAAVGGADLAAATGFLLAAAARRTPVVLDGVVPVACALVAHRVAFRAKHWWVAGHASPEPSHSVALTRLGLVPLLDLGLRLGEGTGALLAVPLVQAAAATVGGMATFEGAGVSDRARDGAGDGASDSGE